MRITERLALFLFLSASAWYYYGVFSGYFASHAELWTNSNPDTFIHGILGLGIPIGATLLYAQFGRKRKKANK